MLSHLKTPHLNHVRRTHHAARRIMSAGHIISRQGYIIEKQQLFIARAGGLLTPYNNIFQ